jgi:hypothetical protein
VEHNLEGFQNLLLAFKVHTESYHRLIFQYKALSVELLHSIAILMIPLLFQSSDNVIELYC